MQLFTVNHYQEMLRCFRRNEAIFSHFNQRRCRRPRAHRILRPRPMTTLRRTVIRLRFRHRTMGKVETTMMMDTTTPQRIQCPSSFNRAIL